MLAAILDPDLVPGEPNLLVGEHDWGGHDVLDHDAMMFLSMIKAALQNWVTLSPNHPWLPLLLDQAGDGGGVDGKAKHEQTWQQVG